MKPTLLVLAAGIGSRYGGLKQIDPVGPAGQIIIDYSIYDAIRGGFGKVVFVIRKDIEQQFRECIGSRFESKIRTEYVFQELDARIVVVNGAVNLGLRIALPQKPDLLLELRLDERQHAEAGLILHVLRGLIKRR